MKINLKTVGVLILTFVLVANLEYAFQDYDAKNNTSGFLIAQTGSSTDGGGDTNDGTDSGGESNAGETSTARKYYREVLTARFLYVISITAELPGHPNITIGSTISSALLAQYERYLTAEARDSFKIVCHQNPAGNYLQCTSQDWTQCIGNCPTPTGNPNGGGTN